MALYLSPDELREVSLAILAYKEALDQHNASGVIGESIRTLEAARHKIALEWERIEKEVPARSHMTASP